MPRRATSTTPDAQQTANSVVVFDADHAPERNFLQETIGYFSENEEEALPGQTPHFFSNRIRSSITSHLHPHAV